MQFDMNKIIEEWVKLLSGAPPEEKKKVIKCECGGEKLKLPHSHWCPKSDEVKK